MTRSDAEKKARKIAELHFTREHLVDMITAALLAARAEALEEAASIARAKANKAPAAAFGARALAEDIEAAIVALAAQNGAGHDGA